MIGLGAEKISRRSSGDTDSHSRPAHWKNNGHMKVYKNQHFASTENVFKVDENNNPLNNENSNTRKRDNSNGGKPRQHKCSNMRGKTNGGRKGRRFSKTLDENFKEGGLANPPSLVPSLTPTFGSTNGKGKGKGKAKRKGIGNRPQSRRRDGKRAHSTSAESVMPWTRNRPRLISDENLDR